MNPLTDSGIVVVGALPWDEHASFNAFSVYNRRFIKYGLLKGGGRFPLAFLEYDRISKYWCGIIMHTEEKWGHWCSGRAYAEQWVEDCLNMIGIKTLDAKHLSML